MSRPRGLVAAAAKEAAKARICSTRRFRAGRSGRMRGRWTFMVGGLSRFRVRARRGDPEEHPGKTIVHAGPSGAGQTAKICNNMILAVSMIGVCEGLCARQRLGLPAGRPCGTSAARRRAQCWAMNNYCPMPGPVPAAPSNLRLCSRFHRGEHAEGSAPSPRKPRRAGSGAPSLMGAAAANFYQLLCRRRRRLLLISSGIMQFVRGPAAGRRKL